MNARTRIALGGAISKWKNIVAGKDTDRGVTNCPLCELFYDHLCKGCPVSAETGQTACQGTPYQDQFVPAKTAHYYAALSGRTYHMDAAKADMKVAAKVELKFLQGLLP